MSDSQGGSGRMIRALLHVAVGQGSADLLTGGPATLLMCVWGWQPQMAERQRMTIDSRWRTQSAAYGTVTKQC